MFPHSENKIQIFIMFNQADITIEPLHGENKKTPNTLLILISLWLQLVVYKSLQCAFF